MIVAAVPAGLTRGASTDCTPGVAAIAALSWARDALASGGRAASLAPASPARGFGCGIRTAIVSGPLKPWPKPLASIS